MARINITGSVGLKGENVKNDIRTIQIELNKHLNHIKPTKKLSLDGSFGRNIHTSKTLAAIKLFQKNVVKLRQPDGLISVNGITHKTLAKMSGLNIGSCNVNALTFPGTNFVLGKPKLTVEQCIATLPKELRSEFRRDIVSVIRKMYNHGIAMGAPSKFKAGYRSFAQQYSIPSRSTKAGPGESFHNYGLAVDLGVLEWVDSDGKRHSDFWLGKMDGKAGYRGLSSKIWKLRNSFCSNKVHSLSWEIIHLQGLPARTSGRSALVKCLNKVASNTKYEYKKGGSKSYECKLPNSSNWVNIGTAKELWSGKVKNCPESNKDEIISHFKKCEEIAKTILL